MMPEYICNTSPLQYLHQLGRIEILPALTGRIIVPVPVIAEMEAGGDCKTPTPANLDLQPV